MNDAVLQEKVDSLRWSHHSLRLATGSKDGTAKIWRYERRQWRCLTLDMDETVVSTARQHSFSSPAQQAPAKVCVRIHT